MELLLQSITSKSNPKIVRTAKYADKKHRDQDHVFICEGIKLLEEAILAGARIREIYLEESAGARWSDRLTELISQLPSVECFSVSRELYSKISTESAPQGILAVVEKTDNIVRSSQVEVAPEETVMLFESVRDPGNMGTLIRTAAAFGFDRLILSADCADVFNPKVLRSTMSGIFSVDIFFDDGSAIKKFADNGYDVVGTFPVGSTNSCQYEYLPKTLVVMGNEANGICPEIEKMCTGRVSIPMSGNAESLNVSVACGIMLYEVFTKTNWA